jgi:transketolase
VAEEAPPGSPGKMAYDPAKPVATRVAYGNALKRLAPQFPQIVSLDGEVSNSTMAEIFARDFPERFFEMYIAEQNMVGAGLGMALRGKIPFVSTFAAFFSRAFDQIRMSQYSAANLKFVGSHAGVSIGEDGPSQMGLEDLAMFRTVLNSVVLYPCDAVATEKLVEQMARHQGIAYLRTTRGATPIIYSPEEEFPIGGFKVLRAAAQDRVAVLSAGVTVFEALKACDELAKEGVHLRVIDLYCLKPLDGAKLRQALRGVQFLVTAEDHYAEGGLADAVRAALADHPLPLYSLAVLKKPMSGKPGELLDYEDISARGIIKQVKEVLKAG